MKEFMLLIRNEIDDQAAWPSEQLGQFLKKCEVYIGNLKKEGKLISARPLVREGRMISGNKGAWKVMSSMKPKKCRWEIITFSPKTWTKLFPLQRKTLNSNMVRLQELKFV